jgi:pSer/pThr/pTyr-binding forkhead associated (FHA) protein
VNRPPDPFDADSEWQLPPARGRSPTLPEVPPAVPARAERSRPATDFVPFRPVLRPSTALLCVLDDGREDGELIRLRGDRTVLGRGLCDVAIPHDELMSAQHAAIERHRQRGRYAWTLTDLDSKNGTYVKVKSAILKDGQEILVGGTRLRFDAPPAASAPAAQTTLGWDEMRAADLCPSVVRLLPAGDGPRVVLSEPENWVGRDSRQCTVPLPDDRLVSRRHARLAVDLKGRWRVYESPDPGNGVWLRLAKVRVPQICTFQLGEQRFVLQVP